MLKIKFDILGKQWTLRVLKKKHYRQKNGDSSCAVTKGWKRTIDLGPLGFDVETIRHELVHAFLSEMGYDSVEDMTAAQMEELCAELFGKRGPDIIALADELLRLMANPPPQE